MSLTDFSIDRALLDDLAECGVLHKDLWGGDEEPTYSLQLELGSPKTFARYAVVDQYCPYFKEAVIMRCLKKIEERGWGVDADSYEAVVYGKGNAQVGVAPDPVRALVAALKNEVTT